MNVIISFEIMNFWFKHVVNYHCFPHLDRIALKVIVSDGIVNRNIYILILIFLHKESFPKSVEQFLFATQIVS